MLGGLPLLGLARLSSARRAARRAAFSARRAARRALNIQNFDVFKLTRVRLYMFYYIGHHLNANYGTHVNPLRTSNCFWNF